jgi:hypothetical protein
LNYFSESEIDNMTFNKTNAINLDNNNIDIQKIQKKSSTLDAYTSKSYDYYNTNHDIDAPSSISSQSHQYEHSTQEKTSNNYSSNDSDGTTSDILILNDSSSFPSPSPFSKDQVNVKANDKRYHIKITPNISIGMKVYALINKRYHRWNIAQIVDIEDNHKQLNNLSKENEFNSLIQV